MCEYRLTEKFDTETKSVVFGEGRTYYIEKNKTPYLTVCTDKHIFYDDETACIFGGRLCVGANDKVYFLNLETLQYMEMDAKWYFYSFFVYENMLYVSSGTGITKLNDRFEVIWDNQSLAVDGVLVQGVTGDGLFIEAECETDPPGGWQTVFIDIETGRQKC